MEQATAFVKMNQYILACYTIATKNKNNINAIMRERAYAFGAFEMFRALYPNAFTEEQYNTFWDFYKDAFETLISQSKEK